MTQSPSFQNYLGSVFSTLSTRRCLFILPDGTRLVDATPVKSIFYVSHSDANNSSTKHHSLTINSSTGTPSSTLPMEWMPLKSSKRLSPNFPKRLVWHTPPYRLWLHIKYHYLAQFFYLLKQSNRHTQTTPIPCLHSSGIVS
jgi:hypothetical protein